MDKLCPVYSLTDSMFVVTKDKECTARVATWKQYGINNCYTLEMSVCGAGKGKYDFYHFNQEILEEISQKVFNCIYELHHPDGECYKEI